jgi:hypothetical protein
MGLPMTAGCDTAWNQIRVSSDASSTEMQCLRPLRHSGPQDNASSTGLIPQQWLAMSGPSRFQSISESQWVRWMVALVYPNGCRIEYPTFHIALQCYICRQINIQSKCRKTEICVIQFKGNQLWIKLERISFIWKWETNLDQLFGFQLMFTHPQNLHRSVHCSTKHKCTKNTCKARCNLFLGYNFHFS